MDFKKYGQHTQFFFSTRIDLKVLLYRQISTCVIVGLLSLFSRICKALSILFSIKKIWYFCYFNEIFSNENLSRFGSSSSTMVQISPAKQNGIFLRQFCGWFDVKGTYLFESVGRPAIYVHPDFGSSFI